LRISPLFFIKKKLLHNPQKKINRLNKENMDLIQTLSNKAGYCCKSGIAIFAYRGSLKNKLTVPLRTTDFFLFLMCIMIPLNNPRIALKD